ncbi:hypothetical protein BKA70DRAFT_1425485 [Coprinopsis sp. MPI-PUGE-AT-0042]|nr:hypothetical protein BKA70DRAFT_1425485 [Coprinopsis sp. MPI-PUGE-AT-0042]
MVLCAHALPTCPRLPSHFSEEFTPFLAPLHPATWAKLIFALHTTSPEPLSPSTTTISRGIQHSKGVLDGMGCLCSSVARWTADTTDTPERHRPRTRERPLNVIHGKINNRTISPTRPAEAVPVVDEQRPALASRSSNTANALEDFRPDLSITSFAGPIPLSEALGANFSPGSIISFDNLHPSLESPTRLTDAVLDHTEHPSSRSSSSDAIHALKEYTTGSSGTSERASPQVSSANVIPLSSEDAVSFPAGTILVSDESRPSGQVESSTDSSEAIPFSGDHDHDHPTNSDNPLIEHRPILLTSSAPLLSEHRRNEVSLPACFAGTIHPFSERRASPLPPTCPVGALCANGMATIGQVLERIQITSGQLGLNVAARDVHSHAHYYGSSSSIEPVLPSAIEPVQIPQVADGPLDVAVNIQMHSGIPLDLQTESIIHSLLQSIEDFRATHLDLLHRATPGTCLWIARLNMFQSFQDPSSLVKIMWGTGIPGAGKTTLASVVINILETHAKKSTTPIICVCYVYFRYNGRSPSSMAYQTGFYYLSRKSAIFLSALHFFDIAPPIPYRTAEDVYARHIHERKRPSERVLLELLKRFTGMMAVTFYILEALDEAPIDIQWGIVQKLSLLDVKIFITSRPMRDLEALFPNAHCFHTEAQAQDIDLHIAHEISCSPDLQEILDQDPSLRGHLMHSVKANCSGMFLHVCFQLEALRQCISVQDVRDTLRAYPTYIEDVYLKTWRCILAQTPLRALLARNVLAQVVEATRPLTIQQLRVDLAVCPDTHSFEPQRMLPEQLLIDVCCGFLVVGEKTRLVRLVHYTAKDVLGRLVGDAIPRPETYPLRRALL